MRRDVGTPKRDSAIRLPDGRRLAYAEWGDLQGRPVLYFHGMPHSRVFFPDPGAAANMGVRAITVDRPGMGGSDPQPGHGMADWPADVTALADALELARFGVVGWSAGVSYALACAALIAERLTGVAVTTSNAALAYLIHDDPDLRESWLDDDERAILDALPRGLEVAARETAAAAAGWVRDVAARPELILDGGIDQGDAWFFDDSGRRAGFLDAVREAVRQGPDAIAPQWVALLAPWGFRLEDIEIPVRA